MPGGVHAERRQVFLGKLEGLGGDYPVPRNVFFIQNQMHPETKQVSSVLLKRAAELHGPDMMVINAGQIGSP